MAAPQTIGQLRTNIQDMEIGDYIKVGVKSGKYEFNYGTTEIPLTGNASWINESYFYFIKLAKGILVSDRVIIHSITWDAINAAKMMQGTPYLIGGIDFIYRSLTGGIAYADAAGNLSLTDKGYGAFPTNNEFDKLLLGFDESLIQQGKTLNDVFHYVGMMTWTQDTTITGRFTNSINTTYVNTTNARRVNRGLNDIPGWGTLGLSLSNTSLSNIGFRPVLEYKEV